MDDFKKWESKYGMENPVVEFKLGNMIACKEMVESLIGEQVHLQHDGFYEGREMEYDKTYAVVHYSLDSLLINPEFFIRFSDYVLGTKHWFIPRW